jgi:hypothetical protein
MERGTLDLSRDSLTSSASAVAGPRPIPFAGLHMSDGIGSFREPHTVALSYIKLYWYHGQ